MRPNLVAILILFLLTALHSNSQSVYGFQFNFHSPTDSITYHAFMLRNNDGSGLVRVRYQPNNSNDDILVQMDINEEYAPARSGLEDTNTLIITGINPQFLIGESKPGYRPPSFIFKYNAANDFFEPFSVIGSTYQSQT